MSQRETIVRALLRYDRPPDEVLAELEGYDPELGEVQAEPPEEEDEDLEVELTPDDAIAVLTRFVEGEIDVSELDHWAEAVRNLDVIVLEQDHREPLKTLLDEVTELTGDAAEDWIARLDPDD